ncbi:hypothetical protein [Halobacterium yunchengense]|uniref:hypothetical protein n=1 Tax=Halobacterium yunchengense TaxID=3108497 RepID=UPI003008AE38
MNVGDVPVVGEVVEAGADDRVFDGLLLAGPLVVALIAVLGRTPVTVAVAAGYVAVFVAYTLWKAVE